MLGDERRLPGDSLVRLELHARAHIPRVHGTLRAAPGEHDLVEKVGDRRHGSSASRECGACRHIIIFHGIYAQFVIALIHDQID